MTDRTYVILGITGKQGGATANALLDKRLKVRGITRNPDSEKSNTWKAKGVEMVSGADLSKAFAGCYGLFIVLSNNHDMLPFAEQLTIGTRYIDTAVEAGIKHIVYSSVANLDLYPDLLPSKYDIELYLRGQAKEKGFTFSVVRPVNFYENMIYDYQGRLHPQDNFPTTIKLTCPGDHKLWHIAMVDIGKVSAECLADAEKYNGRAFDLGAENVTHNEIVAAMNEAWGFSGDNAITFSDSPPQCFFTCIPMCCCCFGFARGIGRMKPFMQWVRNDNYTVDLLKLKEDFPFLMDTKSWVATLPKASRR